MSKKREAVQRLGGAAHARISGLACESEGPRARGCTVPAGVAVTASYSGPTCARVRLLQVAEAERVHERAHVRASAHPRSSFACNSIE